MLLNAADPFPPGFIPPDHILDHSCCGLTVNRKMKDVPASFNNARRLTYQRWTSFESVMDQIRTSAEPVLDQLRTSAGRWSSAGSELIYISNLRIQSLVRSWSSAAPTSAGPALDQRWTSVGPVLVRWFPFFRNVVSNDENDLLTSSMMELVEHRSARVELSESGTKRPLERLQS